ncbi:MAG: prolyl-tRNA synthetase associated domain-containing protein [Alphaproteobacteria bacterium]|nr:prolyl-tRNA synthetase associated domain-containing protein [Alphaproteobacteria bacterium]
MTATEAELFAHLDRLGIAHETVEHKPMFTVEDGIDLRETIPGLDCKNLFLKDKKGAIWLVVMPADKRALTNQLEKSLGSARLSFGAPPLLLEVLGITPGAVSPFALLNDHKSLVNVVLDSDMMAAPLVNFHPLRNTASTALKTEDLLRFIQSLSYKPVITDCGLWPD